MKKLLVTGATGFLGWHVCQNGRTDWELLGGFRSQDSLAKSGQRGVVFDLTNKDQT